jgi:hypothetical protein
MLKHKKTEFISKSRNLPKPRGLNRKTSMAIQTSPRRGSLPFSLVHEQGHNDPISRGAEAQVSLVHSSPSLLV